MKENGKMIKKRAKESKTLLLIFKLKKTKKHLIIIFYFFYLDIKKYKWRSLLWRMEK